MEKFVFDTNVLIDLKYFNPHIFKSLWQNIYNLIEEDKIYSVSEVQLELSKAEDFLHEKWKQIDVDYEFFVDLSEKENSDDYWDAMGQLDSFEVFQRHGESKQLWADPYLIAASMVDGDTVVTNETMNRDKQRKIPYVCQELNIPCMTFDDFMIHQGWEW